MTTPPDLCAAQALAELAALPASHPELRASVVIPARDEAPRIQACLQALARQGIAIRRTRRVRVRTSARTDGRAPRGLAQDLTPC